mmetsp:Transcript_31928/g.47464  ORF Transcript_31928/g.47464 Transcript_31928/m.47464 type:complete len:81 (-) Transcript_31928:402-644(-)
MRVTGDVDAMGARGLTIEDDHGCHPAWLTLPQDSSSASPPPHGGPLLDHQRTCRRHELRPHTRFTSILHHDGKSHLYGII